MWLRKCGNDPLVSRIAPSEISESSELCRDTLRKVTSVWNRQFADLLRQGQLGGSVRSDLTAEQMTDFFWSGWEGALLRMKIENSIEPVRLCIKLMFENFFPAGVQGSASRQG